MTSCRMAPCCTVCSDGVRCDGAWRHWLLGACCGTSPACNSQVQLGALSVVPYGLAQRSSGDVENNPWSLASYAAVCVQLQRFMHSRVMLRL